MQSDREGHTRRKIGLSIGIGLVSGVLLTLVLFYLSGERFSSLPSERYSTFEQLQKLHESIEAIETRMDEFVRTQQNVFRHESVPDDSPDPPDLERLLKQVGALIARVEELVAYDGASSSSSLRILLDRSPGPNLQAVHAARKMLDESPEYERKELYLMSMHEAIRRFGAPTFVRDLERRQVWQYHQNDESLLVLTFTDGLLTSAN